MWDFLKQQNANGTTIILTTHYLEEAESLCNNIAIIDHGVTIKQTQMRTLLNQLNVETFILYLADEIGTLPDCGNHQVRKIDETTLEVDIDRERNISDLFNRLENCGMKVVSMKNKTNRLEQLFISMLRHKKGAAEAIKTALPEEK
jgi:ABC-2 type transport system ATP-binding protein